MVVWEVGRGQDTGVTASGQRDLIGLSGDFIPRDTFPKES